MYKSERSNLVLVTASRDVARSESRHGVAETLLSRCR